MNQELNQAFMLIREQSMDEVGGIARLYIHSDTGAQVLSVCNSDENKVFGVTFRTPSKNATGIAHILEHSTLCGSARYPVKEPFLVLMQGSLQSFLNAFTFPDKTCYPVASANLQDFYNLVDVYIDAVFHPIISENIFRQEGWHIEADEPDGRWQYKGVVFNEMKGVYSSPDSRLAEECQHAIFPGTIYSKDSGGDPAEIPGLTYEQFRSFHSSFYHPSNARFFFWGDDPEEERLNIVARAIEGRTQCFSDSYVDMQPPFTAPTRTVMPYAAEPGSKCLFAINWLTGARSDLEQTMILEMLEHILEGMPGSPLRRALISSGLGEDMAGVGLETDLVQTYYSTGLKGIDEKDIPAAEELIQSTLKDLADGGIAPSLVEAAVNTIEFSYREYNFGRFPRGLVAMLQALATWLYDGDPLASMAWEKPLNDIKARLAAGEKVFENALRELFLDNPSRATVILTPDTGLAAKTEAEEQARLDDIQAKSSPEERRAVCEICAELQKAQSTPDSPEALATIPNLGIADMPAENRITPRSVSEGEKVSLVSSELETRGIAYMSVHVPMPQLPARLLPALNLFMRSIREFGTARHDYTELGALIDAKTGGLSASTSMVVGADEKLRCYLKFSGKTVSERIPDFFSIVEEMLLEPVTDRELMVRRLREMLLEDKARLEQGLLSSGNASASLRVRSHFTTDAAMAEITSGIRYLDYVRRNLDNWDEAQAQMLEDLAELRRLLVAGRPAVLGCIGSGADIERTFACGSALLGRLPAAAPAAGLQIFPLADPCRGEVFTTPSQVNYVAKGCNLYQLGYRYSGSASVILRHVSRSYLWETVRVLGGAYGAGCSLARTTGNYVCTSYRDPNVESTVAAFDGIAGFLEKTALSGADLERAVVGAIGDMDAYMLPDARGSLALNRWLAGITDEHMQQIREEVLATTAADFR
ncbi:MAG: insulinase family protein, partial [Desulfovibrionaceae bacterium]|nr:insulinase family protein [Desulfovibrionaceae bacterium]